MLVVYWVKEYGFHGFFEKIVYGYNRKTIEKNSELR